MPNSPDRISAENLETSLPTIFLECLENLQAWGKLECKGKRAFNQVRIVLNHTEDGNGRNGSEDPQENDESIAWASFLVRHLLDKPPKTMRLYHPCSGLPDGTRVDVGVDNGSFSFLTLNRGGDDVPVQIRTGQRRQMLFGLFRLIMRETLRLRLETRVSSSKPWQTITGFRQIILEKPLIVRSGEFLAEAEK